MAATITWNGEEIKGKVRALIWERIRRAVVTLWTAIEAALNIHNPPPYVTPSLPGEPPRKRTGFLQANTVYEFNQQELAGRVGVRANAKYGLYLELGTKRMAARPFIFATLKKTMSQLRAIMGLGGTP